MQLPRFDITRTSKLTQLGGFLFWATNYTSILVLVFDV